MRKRTVTPALAALAAATAVASAALASAGGGQQISQDPYTNATSQHETLVEPDTFAYGSTVVAAFQAGRFYGGGGASNIGWATSADGGTSWASGFLPSLTTFSTPPGTAGRASDPSTAFDSEHGLWLISSLTCAPAPDSCSTAPTSVAVSRSPDGTSWSAPVTVATGSLDKEWVVCDNGPASPFRGRCYVSWTDNAVGRTLTSASTDGGLTWGTPVAATWMVGVQPVVRPDGTLVIIGVGPSNLLAVRSIDGGASFSSAAVVSWMQSHNPTGMRAPALPSAEVDANGNVYVAWADCRFREGCSSNDILMAASPDGVDWTPGPMPVPIDSTTSGVDHFIPGLGVDPATAGATARIGISFYYFPVAACTVDACQLNVGFISSSDGGATWSGPTQLNSEPVSLSWLANTSWPGRMVGDYISTSFVSGHAVPVFSVASAPTGTTFHQMMAAAVMLVTPTPTPTPTPVFCPDADGDGLCDSDDPDDDGDGFSDVQEGYMTTDELASCPASGDHDAWPSDRDHDRDVDSGDAIKLFGGKMMNPQSYDRRSDAAGDGDIDAGDVIKLIGQGQMMSKCYQLTFTNSTGGTVDDIHIEWGAAVTAVFSARDSALAGWSSRTLSGGGLVLDMDRPDSLGDLAAGGTLTVVVQGPKAASLPIASCRWTLDGVDQGTC